MNRLLVFVAIVFSNLASGQTKTPCDKGMQRAIKDFSHKIYTLQTLGQVVDKDFDPVFVAYAKQKYKIRITQSADVIFPEAECYSKTMRVRVLKKFGPNIEQKMKAEALEVFKKSNPYLTEIKPKIDTGFVFNVGHTDAKYPGDEPGIRAFLCNNINETKSSYWTAYVSFIVEKDGSVSNLIFTKEVKPEAEIEVRRLFLLMDKWTPATYYGEKIRIQKFRSISSKKEMEMRDEIRQKQAAEWHETQLLKKQQKKKPKKVKARK